MTEERFVELMNRIPAMEEKLNKLLLAFEKISQNQNMMGIKKNDEFPPLEFDEDIAAEHESVLQRAREKEIKAEELKRQAYELRSQLDI